jgi:hypothetical protein
MSGETPDMHEGITPYRLDMHYTCENVLSRVSPDRQNKELLK